MKNYFLKFLLFTLIQTITLLISQTTEVKDGWIYINNEKFFIKGIGYETKARPGQVPWKYYPNSEFIKSDFLRIKEAGFNTIRTWGALEEEELKLVEESGLKIIFGIWIDPHGDYGDSDFIQSSIDHVTQVMNYTKKDNSIITYLIMNEHLVEDIDRAGAVELTALWNLIKNIINIEHPGIPVSFSNTIIGDFISTDFWELVAYNIYIYNPVTVSSTLGYKGMVEMLKKERSANKPLIITEFGLSVSPGETQSDYGYGRNTLTQQAEGNLHMYRGLIDGGAQGGCVFQYHDGWWKGGNEFVHDETPEEWFGLNEFIDGQVTPRPSWKAFFEYNTAIITSPKNGECYTENIPIEIFPMLKAKRFEILLQDSLVYEEELNGTHYTDILNLNLTSTLKDCEFVISFFSETNDTLKTEKIKSLVSKEEIMLPTLAVDKYNDTYIPGGGVTVSLSLNTGELFQIENNKIDYAFHPHIGFDEGSFKSLYIDSSKTSEQFEDHFSIPYNSKVGTISSGTTIKYGSFSKRIYDWDIQIEDNWANAIVDTKILTGIYRDENIGDVPEKIELKQNYPNPFNPKTKISFCSSENGNIKIEIFNVLGEKTETLINTNLKAGVYSIDFDGSKYSSGVYFYTMQINNFRQTKKMLLQK